MKEPSDSLSHYTNKFNELKTIFDSLPDGIVAILDREMKVAAVNKIFSQMFNFSKDQIIGNSIKELFFEKYKPIYEIIEQTINNKKAVRNFTVEWMNSEGQTSSFLASTAIIKDEHSEDLGIVLILHDVSEITRLRKIAIQVKRYGEIIGNSDAMKEIYSMIDGIKNYNTSVLLVGETGTGKELVARAIHEVSNRSNAPFIPINCSALPSNLIESELFGHVKGAFTGATSSRQGRFQMADNGTLFLDEIGTLNIELQVKLLRVLQERVVEPVGSNKSFPINVRIISASNRDLSELVKQNEFREDLLYRLKVLQINLPPLRNRKEDIALLVSHFIDRLNLYYNKNIIGISNTALEILNNYPWPGNIRELENSIEHAFVLTNGSIIEAFTLPIDIQHFGEVGNLVPPKRIDLGEEEEKIRKALISFSGNMELTAENLGVHRSTLWRKMKEFNISKGFGKNN